MTRWVLLLGLAGCAGTQTQTTPRPAPAPTATPTPEEPAKATLSLDEGLLADRSNPNVAAAWTVYGGALAIGWNADHLTRESAARAALSKFWAERKDKAADKYLDELATVVEAGFVEDYSLAYFSEPGWTIGGATLAKLRPTEFMAWAKARLAKHEPKTMARVSWAGDRGPLGKELGKGVEFRDLADCPPLSALLGPRLAEFEPTLAKRGPVPLSISKLDALYRALASPETRPDLLARGVVLLSPNVAQAYRLAGICAVEAHDGPRAEGYLRHLVALNPGDVQGHLELTHTLVMQRRWQEAAKMARRALSFAESRCNQAIAWRKIGYVEIERQNLEGARDAYVKSLQLDPGNKIAISELNLIDEKTGRRTPEPSPLPLTDEERRTGMRTTVTHCPN